MIRLHSLSRAAAAALVMAAAQPAAAQRPTTLTVPVFCAPLERIHARLANEFGEKPVYAGKTFDGAALIIFAAPEGEWTAVWTPPGRVGCIFAGGPRWRALPLPKGDGT